MKPHADTSRAPPAAGRTAKTQQGSRRARRAKLQRDEGFVDAARKPGRHREALRYAPSREGMRAVIEQAVHRLLAASPLACGWVAELVKGMRGEVDHRVPIFVNYLAIARFQLEEVMNTRLWIRCASGRYREASANEVLEAAAAYVVDESRGEKLTGPTDGVRLLRALCGGREHEAFAVLWLDTRHRVIDAEVLFSGTIDGASVYPRRVAKRALEVNAAACIVGHNHPSGAADPSEADKAISRRLRDVLRLIDVRLLDSIVVTNESHTSLAEIGVL